MSEHITHREFQDAIAPLVTKRELEIWSGTLVGRMDAQFETLQLHLDAIQRNMEAMQQDMRERLATATSSDREQCGLTSAGRNRRPKNPRR